MTVLELAYHQMFPEDGDPGWHAGQLTDGRRVHAAAMPCQPGQLHWAGSVEDGATCQCGDAGTCNLCLIRAHGGLVFRRVTGCYRSANSAVRARRHWAANPDGPQPPAPFNCGWTTMQAVLCQNVPGAPPMPLGTTEHPVLSQQANDEPTELDCEDPVDITEASGNTWKLGTGEGDLNELRHLDGFEFTVRPGEDLPTTLFRQIAEQQITPESLDECSALGHPSQAWAIISGKQKDASQCANCGQTPNFVEESSSMYVRGFMDMDTLTEEFGNAGGKTTRIKHGVEEHIEQGDLIFRFRSEVFEGYDDIEDYDDC